MQSAATAHPEERPADPEAGLTLAEVQARQRQHGYNEVPEVKPNPVLQFARKFWGVTAWMLELIIVLSWSLHKIPDVVIITLLLVVNAIISFAEEQRASTAIEALKQRLQVNARVLREGQWQTVPARELVPGDIIRVRSGDFVPADARVIHGQLGVDQSALTGESLQVDKEAEATLYSGSIVRRGEANGQITATGTATYFGRTAQLVQMARPRLHVEEVISQVVKWLLVIVGVLVALATVVSVLQGAPLFDILPLMLVLLLGAIPIALPVMFTVSMAIGAMELARKGVLVTRLSASEDAATMNVLCVDKTGTITQNRLSVVHVLAMEGFTDADVTRYGALASSEANQDPIDMAFLTAARQNDLLDPTWVQSNFVPFDPQTRRTEAVVQKDGREFRVIKGALATVAQACGLGSEQTAQLEARAGEYAQKGYRTLAVARTDAAGQWQLVGLANLLDPPRPDSKELLQQLQRLGVSVKMLTGDALPIAREIATGIGLGANIVRAGDLQALAKADPAKALELAEQSDAFAEIYPEDKYTVVKTLQDKGHVVGMTGDGVNDAPALRQAEVGIAVSNATDVAKGAASVVLVHEGLSGIVDLVTNGRRIYQRILTWIINKISRTILKSCFVVGAYLFTGKFVISAFAMILVTFMNDFAKITLSTDNVRWSEQPETWNVTALVKVAVVLGLLMVAEAFGLLYLGLKHLGLGASDPLLYTFNFEVLFYFAVFSLFVVRERRHFWESRPSRPLRVALLADATVATIIATVGLPGLAPLPLQTTALVIAYACFFSLLVNDRIKFALVQRAGLTW